MEITERINELIELGNDYRRYDDVEMYIIWRCNVSEFAEKELNDKNLSREIKSLFESGGWDGEQKIFEILDCMYRQGRINELICYSSVYTKFCIPFGPIIYSVCYENFIDEKYEPSNLLKTFESYDEIIVHNWKKDTSIGLLLGNNNYITLDFNGISNDENFIDEVLNTLNLPQDYEWVIMNSHTNNRFQILIKNSFLFDSYRDTVLFGPEINFSLLKTNQNLNTISLRSSGCAVLPPSIDPGNVRYYFRSHKIPKSEPLKLGIHNIDFLLSKYCSGRQFSSYNLRDSHRNFELTETKKIHISFDHDEHPQVKYEDDTISWLESVNEGEALNTLAIKYLVGEGVEQNSHKAIRYFQKSNTQSSIFNLISLHSVGLYNANKQTLFNLCRKLNIEAFKSHIKKIENNLGYSLPLSKKCLFIDTETTGVPQDRLAKITDSNSWPRLVQLSWFLTDFMGNTISDGDYLIKPKGFLIPNEATRVHGITTEHAIEQGYDLSYVLSLFQDAVNHSDLIIGHNVDFDKNVISAELLRKGKCNVLQDAPVFCTMKGTIDYCKIPGFRNSFRYPKLQELYFKLFNHNFENAHDSFADVTATKDCFFKLLDDGIIDISELFF